HGVAWRLRASARRGRDKERGAGHCFRAEGGGHPLILSQEHGLHKPPEPAGWIVRSVLVFNPASRAREDQMRGTQKASLFIAGLAVVAAGACGDRSSTDGDDLSPSLELTPRGGSSQAVVSAIEAGPTAAPTHAARKSVAKPVTHPAPLRAAPQHVA